MNRQCHTCMNATHSTHPHVRIFHAHGHYGCQNIQSLSHDGASLECVCLQQAVEDLQNDPLVDGKPCYDVCQQEVTVILGGWVLGRGRGRGGEREGERGRERGGGREGEGDGEGEGEGERSLEMDTS